MTRRSRVALFGGTFDPVHWGHLLIAEAARDAFHLDRVLFLPSGQPPHKHPPEASVPQRLAMVRRAIAGNPFFEINSWEAQQPRVVYTTQTLDHFRAEYPQAALFFIMGSDSLKQVDSWFTGRDVLRKATFLIVERPEAPWSSIPKSLRQRVHRVPCPPVALASHDIRARIRRRSSIHYQVPERVEQYIHDHRVYHR